MKAIWRSILCLLIFSFLIIACENKEKRSKDTQIHGPSGPIQLFLVRHAQAFKNLNPMPKLPARQLDSLTETGKKQAAALGKYLKNKGITAIYASPTGRTRQTAEIIRQNTGLQDSVIIQDDLRALDKGFMSTGSSSPLSGDMNMSSDKGESMAEGEQRVINLVNRLSKELSGRAVVFVTHGDICAAILARANGAAPASGDSPYKMPAGSVCELVLSSAQWIIKKQAMVPEP